MPTEKQLRMSRKSEPYEFRAMTLKECGTEADWSDMYTRYSHEKTTEEERRKHHEEMSKLYNESVNELTRMETKTKSGGGRKVQKVQSGVLAHVEFCGPVCPGPRTNSERRKVVQRVLPHVQVPPSM